MKEFTELSKVFDILLGPGGCPWDQKQTVQSIRADILEEVHEVLEAISLDDNIKICEELGDVFACSVFLCKLAEKEGRFTMTDVLGTIREKLIRRHPHVFGEAKVDTHEQLIDQWEKIKKEERGGELDERKSVLDGIPVTLPALARSQALQSKMHKHGLRVPHDPTTAEEQLGERLWQLVEEAGAQGLDAEEALRTLLTRKERDARNKEFLGTPGEK